LNELSKELIEHETVDAKQLMRFIERYALDDIPRPPAPLERQT
jgi:hypothetical protein